MLVVQVADVSGQKRLIADLLTNYDAVAGVHGRPVHNQSDILSCNLTVGLKSVHDVDPVKQLITLNIWMRMVSQSKV